MGVGVVPRSFLYSHTGDLCPFCEAGQLAGLLSATARTPYTYTNPPVSKRSTSTPAATCGAADKKGCTSTCAVLILWTYGRVGRWQVVSSDQWTRGDAAAVKPRYTVRAKQNKPYQQRGRRALFREQTPILGRFSLRVEEGGANG